MREPPRGKGIKRLPIFARPIAEVFEKYLNPVLCYHTSYMWNGKALVVYVESRAKGFTVWHEFSYCDFEKLTPKLVKHATPQIEIVCSQINDKFQIFLPSCTRK